MGLFGNVLGKVAGGVIGGAIGGKQGKKVGSELGGLAGSAFPGFKTGGKVKRTGLARVHKGEYVLPAGVKPTKAQREKVAKKKKDAKK